MSRTCALIVMACCIGATFALRPADGDLEDALVLERQHTAPLEKHDALDSTIEADDEELSEEEMNGEEEDEEEKLDEAVSTDSTLAKDVGSLLDRKKVNKCGKGCPKGMSCRRSRCVSR
mmetsp:Transcript_40215/g.92447  ORF Transcript_40215/g.92447 Transcript_40215/m.92447 type:complete len:119 (+) Transcript_40215:75-431(+)